MKNAIKVLIFVSIFLIILHCIGSILNTTGTFKEWYQSNAITDFYKQKNNTIDVMFIGNSEIYSSISPLEIYKNNGITGYALSKPGQKIWSSYYFLIETSKTQSPKVMFLSVGDFFSDVESQDEMSKRKAIDSLKLSKNKINMILDKDYNFSNYEKLSCIFPAIRYHSRWSKITEQDIRKIVKKNEETYKGYLISYIKNSYKGKNTKISRKNKENSNFRAKGEEDKEISPEVKEKLYKIKNIYKKNNCKLILFKAPEPTIWNEDKHEIIYNFAEENGLEFLDFNQDGIVEIDWKNDTYDGGNHLNENGAEKVSFYIGEYLKEKYKLTNHKNDNEYKEWDKLVLKYEEVKQAIKLKQEQR